MHTWQKEARRTHFFFSRDPHTKQKNVWHRTCWLIMKYRVHMPVQLLYCVVKVVKPCAAHVTRGRQTLHNMVSLYKHMGDTQDTLTLESVNQKSSSNIFLVSTHSACPCLQRGPQSLKPYITRYFIFVFESRTGDRWEMRPTDCFNYKPVISWGDLEVGFPLCVCYHCVVGRMFIQWLYSFLYNVLVQE